MEVLRTPDERFADLEDYPFAPNYVQVSDELRMHYVDEGSGEVVLLLHGEPTWSYLYRRMIPIIAGAGYRAIAPDLIGFGRSDKPASIDDYSFQRHVDWTWALCEALSLNDITLVGQDWGSLIGLRLAAEHPDRFARIVMANGFLPTGDQPPNEEWFRFRDAVVNAEVCDVPRFVQSGSLNTLTPRIRAGYDAPFPEERFKAAARAFPRLVPATPDDPAAPANRKAWEVLSAWQKPFLTAFGSGDKIFTGLDRFLQKVIPGANGQPHTVLDAGHFIQEDKGEQLAEVVVDWLRETKA